MSLCTSGLLLSGLFPGSPFLTNCSSWFAFFTTAIKELTERNINLCVKLSQTWCGGFLTGDKIQVSHTANSRSNSILQYESLFRPCLKKWNLKITCSSCCWCFFFKLWYCTLWICLQGKLGELSKVYMTPHTAKAETWSSLVAAVDKRLRKWIYRLTVYNTTVMFFGFSERIFAANLTCGADSYSITCAHSQWSFLGRQSNHRFPPTYSSWLSPTIFTNTEFSL